MNKLSINQAISSIFMALIPPAIYINLKANNIYDKGWTIGEWLISYSGGFIRRGLPGTIIHTLSKSFDLPVIYLIWAASLCSYAALCVTLVKLCGGKINKALLLSPLILLAPLLDNFLVRKDVLVASLYGMCLLANRGNMQNQNKFHKAIITVNILSILAILSHESFGFWGLPSLAIILFKTSLLSGKSKKQSLISAAQYLAPPLIAFALTLAYKGTIQDAQRIHLSWQSMADLLPSHGALTAQSPPGAIAALGWTIKDGLKLSRSLLYDVSGYFIWTPAAWLCSIYIAACLFISNFGASGASLRRKIVLFQLICISPLFALGWDFGRWIFLWITSSALLYGFASQKEHLIESTNKNKYFNHWEKLFPVFNIKGNLQYTLLFLGIPHCCWSVKHYIEVTPFGFITSIAERAFDQVFKR